MIFDDRASIKPLTNRSVVPPGAGDDLLHESAKNSRTSLDRSPSPTLRQNHINFLQPLRPKHANAPLNPDCHYRQYPLDKFHVPAKRNLQAKIAAWRSGDMGWANHWHSIGGGWATLSCSAGLMTLTELGESEGFEIMILLLYWSCDGGEVRWCHDSNWSTLLRSQRWESK